MDLTAPRRWVMSYNLSNREIRPVDDGIDLDIDAWRPAADATVNALGIKTTANAGEDVSIRLHAPMPQPAS